MNTTELNSLLGGLRGYRKFFVMLIVILTLAGMLTGGLVTSAEFIDALKFISTAFFAANFGEKLAGKKES